MYETNLKKIDDDLKNKVISFLESIDHNESFIVHFLNEADTKPDPKEYLMKKYPELSE